MSDEKERTELADGELTDEQLEDAAGGFQDGEDIVLRASPAVAYQDGEDLTLAKKTPSTGFQDGEDIILTRRPGR